MESSVDEIPDPAFTLPGYRPYVGQYNGPAYPPKIPSLPEPSSDVIAEDLRRRNTMQSQARDW